MFILKLRVIRDLQKIDFIGTYSSVYIVCTACCYALFLDSWCITNSYIFFVVFRVNNASILNTKRCLEKAFRELEV